MQDNDTSPNSALPRKSVSALVRDVAKLLRKEVKELSLKDRSLTIVKKPQEETAAHKIQVLATLLRNKVHEVQGLKSSPKSKISSSKKKSHSSMHKKTKHN